MPDAPTPYLIVALVVLVAFFALLLLWHIWIPHRPSDEIEIDGPPRMYWPRLDLDSGSRTTDWLAVDPPTWNW